MSSVTFSNPNYYQDKAVYAATGRHAETLMNVRDEDSLVGY